MVTAVVLLACIVTVHRGVYVCAPAKHAFPPNASNTLYLST
jgi:hypothetical protein